MFRKSKIEPVEKVKIVERYLAGEIGIQQAGKELGVDHHSARTTTPLVDREEDDLCSTNVLV